MKIEIGCVVFTLLMVILTLGCEYFVITRESEPTGGKTRAFTYAMWGIGVFKGLASLGFLTFFYVITQEAYAVRSHDVEQQVIWWALIASAVGDLLLVSERESFFLSGLIAFFIAHIAYAVAFIHPLIAVDVSLSIPIVVSIIIGVGLMSTVAYRSFHEDIPKSLTIPSIAYTSVIAIMVICAAVHTIYLECLTIMLGAVAFWLSDLAVAKQRFHGHKLLYKGFYVRLWGLPLYYVAQLLMASEVIGLY